MTPIKLEIETALPLMIEAFKNKKLQFQDERGIGGNVGCYYRAPFDETVTCIVGACISDTEYKRVIDFHGANQNGIADLMDNNHVLADKREIFRALQQAHDRACHEEVLTDASNKFIAEFNELMTKYGRPERLEA